MDLKAISSVLYNELSNKSNIVKNFLLLKNDNNTDFSKWRVLLRNIGNSLYGAEKFLLADHRSISHLVHFRLSGVLGGNIRNSIQTLLDVSEEKAIELMGLIESELPDSPKEILDNYEKYQLNFAAKIIAIIEYASWYDFEAVILDAYLMKMEQAFLDNLLQNIKKTYFQEIKIMYVTQQSVSVSLQKESVILNYSDFLPKQS